MSVCPRLAAQTAIKSANFLVYHFQHLCLKYLQIIMSEFCPMMDWCPIRVNSPIWIPVLPGYTQDWPGLCWFIQLSFNQMARLNDRLLVINFFCQNLLGWTARWMWMLSYCRASHVQEHCVWTPLRTCIICVSDHVPTPYRFVDWTPTTTLSHSRKPLCIVPVLLAPKMSWNAWIQHRCLLGKWWHSKDYSESLTCSVYRQVVGKICGL